MAVKKKRPDATLGEAEAWLFKKVTSAPRPLPPGRFPLILADSEREGYPRDLLLDVLDLWLNYGYCELIDQITSDIKITAKGEQYFY